MATWNLDPLGLRPNRKRSQSEHRASNRRRHPWRIEQFEERVLMAISPTLVAIIPNDGEVLQSGQTRYTAPRDLTIRFDNGQIIDPATLGGIQLVRSGNDGSFGNPNDVTIVPGYIGIGDNTNEVIVRFASTLPDDYYQLTIFGSGASPLRNTEGDAFNNGTNVVTPFRLDLGAQILAVVPQPITRGALGALQQAKDTIVVYFNNDKLEPASAQNVNLYQLIFTAQTASSTDDVVFKPTLASYDPLANSVTLTFAANLDALGTGPGTYRLRVGDDSVQPLPPIGVNVASDAGSSIGTAFNLGALTSQSQILSGGAIFNDFSPTNTPYDLILPGGNDNPGHRAIPHESHLLGGPDFDPGIATIAYNFQDVYGTDPQGNILHNVITETQKQRAREIFEMYGYYLGVKFFETPGSGFTIVTGDLRALSPSIPTGPGGVGGIAGGGVAIMDAAENWGDSEFGGGWFTVAMHEIGHLLGLGHSYDLPPLTIQGSEGELAEVPAEPVFPGDADILHGQYMYRPDSKDIDFYRFQLTATGQFTAETIAERLDSPSLADTVLSLYNSTGQLIARNDDYFSADSFIDLLLEPGTYYVAVSSTGNTDFNPLVVDSGFGGTTEGAYSLRLNFEPTPSGSVLVDTTDTKFDGDYDGTPGGEFNFWFNVGANNLYVDKTAPSAGANGSLAKPFNNIAAALAAATPGTVVRIVGNGGADGDVNTLGDNRAYEIGVNQFNTPLSDGATMNVPQDVTVVIDAGAVFKLRQANINVGSFAQGIDYSGSALQVLGTPTRKVTFTSYNNEAIGVDTNPLLTTPAPGDWGGLVFRGGTPDVAADQEHEGIFVNYVGLADIGYGGGTVVVDSQPSVYNPIHMITSRPTVAFNTISKSADAAMSADPDSFAETLFRDDTSTAEYRRVGPEIYGNRFVDDSLNALFVRIRTEAGVPLDVLRVPGRFNDTDIVHVITENLIVQGTPGGPLLTGSGFEARQDARLAIDPGVIVKLRSSRIEVGMSAQLIAEGTAVNRAIFTSLADDRYGAGGTFDTTSDGSGSKPAAGDWGGIYFHPVSKGSLDYALITFAGGSTPIEGSFARFNPIEIRQADVRIANSVLEVNADGRSASDRNGRGATESATIFVRGAQPVVVNNIFRNNSGDSISINANALNTRMIADWGRSTRTVNRFGGFDDNRGPLVALNRLVENDVNALAVRGATLTTETIWDDTDIVHVVRGVIDVPNLHTYGGLRLQSSPTASLVVKLAGPQAGFTANGSPLDIDDRIGGTVEVLGTPGHPVVLTSLNDQTVGAGFDLAGQAQTRTLGGNVPTGNLVSQTNISFRYNTLFSQNTEAVRALEFAAAYWEAVLDDPISLVFDIAFAPLGGPLGVASAVVQALPFDEVRQRLISDSVAGEEIVSQLPTLAQLQTTLDNSYNVGPVIGIARANALAIGYTPDQLTAQYSAHDPTTLVDGSIRFDDATTWDYYRFDGLAGQDFISVAIHEIGHALGFTSFVDVIDGGATSVALTTLDLFRLAPGAGAANFRNSPREMRPGADAVFYDGGLFDRGDVIGGALTPGDIPLSTGETNGDGRQASHWKYRGLLGISEAIGIMDPVVVTNGSISEADSRALGLIGYDVVRRGAPGDWNGVRITEFSNDRNVDVTGEIETAYTGSTEVNGTPSTAQFLGTLAADQKNGDDNRRLGFEIHGTVSFDRPGDVDVYSFNATAGTEIWIDIDRTSASLDTVVELVNANGQVLARSNDSAAESDNPSLLLNNPAGNLARTLQRGAFSSYDLYTINPRDAGMRLVLPGTVGTTSTYYVRVRSNGPNLNVLTGGETSGNYRLQIRLQEVDEFPGSTVRFADIRYAVNGIQVLGMPAHSYQTGETASGPFVSNATFDTAQETGNLLESDRNAIAIASAIQTPLDVDWFKFTIDYQGIQSIGGFSDSGKTWATIFDIDYADGMSRPNLVLSVFDSLGNLVWVSRDSDVADDQPDPLGGSSASDLSRGSFGKLDPFLGSVQMPEGTSRTFYVAVSSNAALPTELNATFSGDAGKKLVRLEPVNSVRRIVEDHIGTIGYEDAAGSQIDPTTPAILPIATIADLQAHVGNFTLADVALFVSQSYGFHTLKTINPQTGQVTSNVGGFGSNADPINDIMIRSDGLLYANQGIGSQNLNPGGNVGRMVAVDPATNALYVVGADAISEPQGNPPFDLDQMAGSTVGAFTYMRFDPAVPNGQPEEHYSLYLAVSDFNQSRLFIANANDGTANIRTDDPWGPIGNIYETSEGDLGRTMGMAFVQTVGLLLFPPSGATVIDGQTFSISDAYGSKVFEFDLGGGVSGTNVPVVVTGAETPAELAPKISAAIGASGLLIAVTPGTGSSLVLEGATGASPGNSQVSFSGLPNGGNTLWGVSDTGKIFTINKLDRSGGFSITGIATKVLDLGLSAPFAGLALGPQNLDHNGDGALGDLSSTLFAITRNGDLYAFNTITGQLRTDIFPGGVNHISTGLQNVTGLAFSQLDFNLWHPTTLAGKDLGHGIDLAPDHSRIPENDEAEAKGVSTLGRTSFYFGIDNVQDDWPNRLGYLALGAPGAQYGVLRPTSQLDLTGYSRGVVDLPPVLANNPALWDAVRLGNNYNFAGGARGSVVTSPFSLEGYTYNDKPTLYFNYHLETVFNASEDTDTAKVYISQDNGQTWVLIGTNDPRRSDDAGRLPEFTSASSNASSETNQHVQQLFSETRDAQGTFDLNWRQARIDIGKWAGQSNLKLRFEFIAGRGDNDHRGFLFDDIIVGFTERGEMVTRPEPGGPVAGDTTYFAVPQNPDPGSETEVLVGPYQLEIRRGLEYGYSLGGTKPDIGVIPFLDTNDRLVRGFTLIAPSGAAVADGETFVISDGVNRLTFEFNSSGGVAAGNVAIPFAPGQTAITVAKSIRDAINSRFGSTFRVSASSIATSDLVDLFGAVDVDDLLAPSLFVQMFYAVGDQNLPRQQGQIILQANRIFSSAGYGILVDAGMRDALGPHAGSIRNLISINAPQLVTGVAVTNNLLAFNQTGGILFSGDVTPPNRPPAPVPFGRIINNTVYGGGQGIGIQVTENAAPTLLNNILAGLQTGISVDPSSSARTVVGGSLFQGNVANIQGVSASETIALVAGEPLFVNASTGNFNLATGSRAIDSAIDSLQDRPEMITINNPVGIGLSPIVAPLTDLTGKQRVDDPSALPPPGIGGNVFKDRGALDRSDFVGPLAVLLNPEDNDTSGIDQDPTLNRVIPVGAVLRDFSIQLVDGTGTGIDPATVTSAKFVLVRDGTTLVDGLDYFFGYDQTNQIVRLTPAAGIWLSGFEYVITLDNSVATGIKDLGANPLSPNELTGVTRFTILLQPLDFGDAPDPSYPTLLTNDGARHVLKPGVFLGAVVTEDTDGRPNPTATGDAGDDGVVFNTPLVPGVPSTITVTASAPGFIDAFVDINGDGDWDDANEKILDSVAVVTGSNLLGVTMPGTTATTTFARFRFSSTGGLGPTGIGADGEVEDYQVTIPPSVDYTLRLINPANNREVYKDGAGRYVVLAETTIEARVYVDDTRPAGAAGGVFAAFADLVASQPLVQWDTASLVVDPEFAIGTSGSVDASLGVDEAGGIADQSPSGADLKRLLFKVRGTILPAATPGTTFQLQVNAADLLPTHHTLVYGVNGPVAATYQTVELIVPTRPWQNPYQRLDVFPDGYISAYDALLIINQINIPGRSLIPLDDTPSPPNVPPPYIDVNGDGYVTVADVLEVIVELNNPTLAEPFIVFPTEAAPVPSALPEEPAAAAPAAPLPAAAPVGAELESASLVVASSAIELPAASLAVPDGESAQLTDLALAVYDELDGSVAVLDHQQLAAAVEPETMVLGTVPQVARQAAWRPATRPAAISAAAFRLAALGLYADHAAGGDLLDLEPLGLVSSGDWAVGTRRRRLGN